MTLAQALQPDDEGDYRRVGPPESFERFVRENYMDLLNFLLRQSSDRHLAEDALHEALIVTMDKWETVSTYDRPVSWVRRTARYKFLTLQTRQKWKDNVPLEKYPDFAEPTSAHEAQLLLNYVLSQLPSRQRAVLTLMAARETDEEIARELDLAVTTVKTYKSEIRKKYRELQSEVEGDPT